MSAPLLQSVIRHLMKEQKQLQDPDVEQELRVILDSTLVAIEVVISTSLPPEREKEFRTHLSAIMAEEINPTEPEGDLH